MLLRHSIQTWTDAAVMAITDEGSNGSRLCEETF